VGCASHAVSSSGPMGSVCIVLPACSFNLFQPEARDVGTLLPHYHGRLSFHSRLSTPRILPFGMPDDVRDESRRLLALGRDGG